MKKILISFLFIAFAVFSSGCSQDSGKTSSQISPASITSIKDEVGGLKNKVVELQTKVVELRNKVFFLEISKDGNKTAWFDTTGEKHYQRVDTNVGYFLVVLENVEPYLDGQKVTLLIGNPNNVTFNGFDIKATWSARMPDGKLPAEETQKAVEAYNKSLKEKEIKLTDTLRPATWNKVRFTIAPANAVEFGNLGIAITTSSVSLATAR